MFVALEAVFEFPAASLNVALATDKQLAEATKIIEFYRTEEFLEEAMPCMERHINLLKKDLDGSEFEVKLTSGNRFFSQTGLKRDQIVRGVLRRRPFRTNVTTSSLLAYSFDVYQLDILPL